MHGQRDHGENVKIDIISWDGLMSRSVCFQRKAEIRYLPNVILLLLFARDP